MSKARAIRELSMQGVFLLDARGEDARDEVERAMMDGPYHDDDMGLLQEVEPLSDQDKHKAIEAARGAWEKRLQADALADELAPDWPTGRRPPIDRAIIRLAWHELVEGQAPAIVIDEAVEISKRYATEQSPPFVNALLDAMRKKLEAGDLGDAPEPVEEVSDEDAWLNDALKAQARAVDGPAEAPLETNTGDQPV